MLQDKDASCGNEKTWTRILEDFSLHLIEVPEGEKKTKFRMHSESYLNE